MVTRKVREVALAESGGFLFTLKDMLLAPETPTKSQPFTITGKITLFGIPFVLPIWVLATVTYPESWWEQIIPIIGSPRVRKVVMATGGDFEMTFIEGFIREGEFSLSLGVYLGPTYPIDAIVLPPAPSVTSQDLMFTVAGEEPPQEQNFRNFVIASYGKVGQTPVSPPNVVALKVGDTLRINLSCEHTGPAVSGKFHVAIWKASLFDPHDEQLSADKDFTIQASTTWQSYSNYIDIPVTSAISPGSAYGLYAKIMGVTGGDVFTEYYANIITIEGAAPASDLANPNLVIQPGTYDIGQQVSFGFTCQYKGKAQSGQLIISLGTGIVPAFLTKYTFPAITIAFVLSYDWKEHTFPGSFILPSNLERGQTYSVRSVLRTADGVQEIDTDWGVITIPAAPPVPPPSDITDWNLMVSPGTYDLGDSVPFTGSYQYKGKAQGGTLVISLGTGPVGAFFTAYTYPATAVSFAEAMDWTPGSLQGDFTLPTNLTRGQTYSVRSVLRTADGVQEIDTDWGVITIPTEPPPPTEPQFQGFQILSYTEKPWQGGICFVKVMFNYRGPAVTKEIYASIGTIRWTAFDELLVGTITKNLPASTSWTVQLGTIRIDIPADFPLATYDLYAKIQSPGAPWWQTPDAITPYLDDVITVIK